MKTAFAPIGQFSKQQAQIKAQQQARRERRACCRMDTGVLPRNPISEP
jgi:hypothetical protein